MEQLHAQLRAGAQGHLPTEEPLPAQLAAAPLLIGADGVRVPFRPEGGQPRGKTAWHEVKVGVLARLGHHRTRTGKVVARLHQRRLVAVFGDGEALKARLWLEALRQGILHAPRVVWLSDGARGLWHLFEERFAGHATGILDLYHAAQQLWKGAAAWLDGRTTQAHRWFGWAPPDLFHVQHELSKAVSAPRAIKERAAHKAAAEAHEQLEQVQTPLHTTGGEPAKRGPGRPPKAPVSLEQAEQALEAASREHERVAQQREQVSKSIRAIGHAYHCVDLERGVRRNGQRIAADIQGHIEQARAIAQHEGLSQSCLERIAKAERVVPKMGSVLKVEMTA